MNKTLFKRTTTGAVQTWQQELDGDRYRTISGKLGGAQVMSEWTVAQPKNVGRANETTAEQQAALEVEAAYVKKLKTGYFESLEAIDTGTKFKPMLAKSADNYPVECFTAEAWFAQPKLDGIRCVARADGLWTRTGEPIPTCPHVSEALAPLFAADPELVLDGELYSDRLAADFNKLVSLAKRKDPSPAQLAESRDGLQYHVYDLYCPTASFAERTARLAELVASLGDCPALRLVPTEVIRDHDHRDELYASYVEVGQEGLMLRRGESKYQQKRSADLLKLKTMQDDEWPILEVCEGQGNRSGMAGYVVLSLGDGRTFKATPKGTNQYRVEMLERAEELVGKLATVQYFALTPAGIPRFPVLKAVHESARW